MENIDRRQLILYLVAIVAVALIGARYLREAEQPGASETSSVEAQPSVRVSNAQVSKLLVHVAGAVRQPGVYSLPANSRINDAIRRAGGRRADADLDALNLAAKIVDGQQVIMPSKRVTSGNRSGKSKAINLNQATLEELDQLDGVGPTMAAKIVEYRQQNGGFGSVSDLDKITGIGEKRLASLKEQLNG